MKKEYNTNIVCPEDSISDMFKRSSWTDQQLPSKEKLGLMHCYCFNSMIKKKLGINVGKIAFNEFEKLNETSKTMAPDETKYCKEWFFNYAAQQSAVVFTSLVVVVINIIAGTVLT